MATPCAPCRCRKRTDDNGRRARFDSSLPPEWRALMALVNFDGIPGPTHNYAGLAHGNLAAERNARSFSNPREAALQGLAKARALAARGHGQAVLPPHERPNLPALRALGFAGTDDEIVIRAGKE